MARGVELAIRAKNEAEKAIDSVSQALDALKKSQDQASTSAGKANNLLGELGKTFVDLNNQVQALGALSKVAAQLDRATDAVGKLEVQVAATTEDLAKLRKAGEDAGTSVAKLASDVDRLGKALDDEKTKTAALRTERTKANAELRKAQSEYDRTTSKIDKAKKASDDLIKKQQEQGEALDQVRRRQQELSSAYDRQVAAQGELTSTLAATRSALKASQDAQAGIQRESEKTAVALNEQTESLNNSRQALRRIKEVVDTASGALGGVATSQLEVAAAAKKAAADLELVNNALKRQKAVPASPVGGGQLGAFAAFKQQTQAVQDVKIAYQEAQTEATRLGRELATTVNPTANLRAQFLLAKEASDQARASYEAQARALTQLRGKAQEGFKGVEKAAANIQAAVAKNNEAGAVNPAQIQAALPPIKKLSEAARLLGGANESAAGSTDKLNDAVRRQGDGSRQSLSLIQRLRGEVLSLTASYVGLFAAVEQLKGVVKAFQTLEAAQSRLGVVFNQNTARVNNEIAFLRDQAGRLGISFSILSNEYGKLAIAAKEANFSQADTRKLFLSVAEAGRVNKLSTEQLTGTFLALTQMLSKGKVSSEELRRQLGDRLSGAFNLFAQALGVSTAQLDEMLRKGEVIANRDTLIKFADRLNQAFGPQLAASLQSFTSELGRLTNNIELSQQRVGQGGFIEALGRLFRTLNEGFQSQTGQDFLLQLGAILGKLTDGVTVLVQNLDVLATALAVFVTLKTASYFTGLFNASNQATGAVAAFGNTYRTVNNAVKAGNAFDLLATGALAAGNSIGGMLAPLGVFTARTNGATLSTRLFSGALAGLRVAMSAAAATARALWVAIGGFPGLIITAITTAIGVLAGRWLTSVDEATTALDRHAKMLDEVRRAYDDAKGNVEEWSKAVRDGSRVTATELNNNTEQLQKKIKEYSEELKKVPTRSGSPDPNANRLADEYDAAIAAFKAGKVSAEQLLKTVTDIANRAPRFQSAFVSAQLEIIRKAAEAERAIKANAEMMNTLSGSALDASAKNLGLADSLAKVDDALDKTKLEAYTEAMLKLGKAIPEMARQAQFEEDLKKASDEFNIAAQNAQGDEQLQSARERFEKRVQTIIKAFDTQSAKLLDLGGNKGLVERIIQIEGGTTPGSPQSKTSSSRGIGQFIESTWLEYFDKAFPDRAELSDAVKLDRRFNPEDARKVIELYLQEIGKQLTAVDIPATAANLYAGYFLGPGGAKALLKADPRARADSVLDARSVAANPSILGGGRTVEEVIATIQKKVGNVGSIADIGSSGATAQEEFNAKLNETLGLEEKLVVIQKQRSANEQLGVQAQFDANRELAIREALIRRTAEAEAENRTLGEQDLQRIRDLAAAQYDASNAVKLQADLRKEAEQGVNEVLDKRKLILEQIELYKNLGDTTKVNELRASLQGVNQELTTAIDRAIAFLKTMGDSPELQKAISGLELIRIKTQDVKKESKITGQAIDDAFLNSATSAFDQFSKAVAEGGNVFKAARNAFLSFASDFLKQIAKMIFQQAILNALGGTGAGGASSTGSGIASIIGGIFHEGGIAGQATQTRAVSPSVFANALRYHVGGIAGMTPGLRPGEVPAILKRNEEILTEDDPRHIFNGGGNSPAVAAQDIKVINTFDAASFMSEGLSTPVGQKAFLNFVSANKRAFQAAIS